MANSDTNFWTGPASGPYRFLAGCMAAIMLLGGIVFLYAGLQAESWRMLMWVPIFLLNSAGPFGMARTGRWSGWRRSAGR